MHILLDVFIIEQYASIQFRNGRLTISVLLWTCFTTILVPLFQTHLSSSSQVISVTSFKLSIWRIQIVFIHADFNYTVSLYIRIVTVEINALSIQRTWNSLASTHATHTFKFRLRGCYWWFSFQPKFPSSIVRPGETYHEIACYKFGVIGDDKK